MDDASPSQEVQQIPFPHPPPPPPVFCPLKFSPSISTFHSRRTSSAVKDPSHFLILQDFGEAQSEKESSASLATLLRQSLQSQNSSPDSARSQEANSKSPTSPPLLPTAFVPPSSIQRLPSHQQNQVKLDQGGEILGLIQLSSLDCFRTCNTSRPPISPHQSLLRLIITSKPAPNSASNHSGGLGSQDELNPAVSCSIFAAESTFASTPSPQSSLRPIPNAQYALSLFRQPREIASWRRSSSALDVLNVPDHRNSSLNIQVQYCHGLAASRMASFTSLFKRPRSRSERAFEERALTPSTPSSTRSPFLNTHSSVPTAVFGNRQRSEGAGGASPIPPPQTPRIVEVNTPTEAEIDRSEIGVKFPTKTLGPGIERKVYIDPLYTAPIGLRSHSGSVPTLAGCSDGDFEDQAQDPDRTVDSIVRMYEGDGLRASWFPSDPPTRPLPSLPVGARHHTVLRLSTALSLQSEAHTQELFELSSSPGPIFLEDSEGFEDQTLEPGPGRSQSSSTRRTENSDSFQDPGSYAVSIQRTRNGTPPLLFGNRPINHEPTTHVVARNGRLASAARSAGLRSDGRLAKVIGRDELDWESAEETKSSSDRGVRTVMNSVGLGSSIADVSDGASVRVVTSGRLKVHPPHPRYQHSFATLRDSSDDELIKVPSTLERTAFPYRNTSQPVESSAYQHPVRLSKVHAHPFGTVPPALAPALPVEQADSQQSQSSRACAEEYRKVLRYVSDVDKDHSAFSVAGKGQSLPSSAWVSTLDESNDSICHQDSSRDGSFSKFAIVGPKGNVTGTLEGSGAREVGSSLADDSSPAVADSSSSKYRLPQTPSNHLAAPTVLSAEEKRRAKDKDRRTINGCLDPDEVNGPGNICNRVKRCFHGSSEYEDLTTRQRQAPYVGHLSPEIRQHRQHLIEHSLLPRLPTPSFVERKRLSVPLELLKSERPANMESKIPATNGTSSGLVEAQLGPGMSGQLVRMRSPRRRVQGENIATNIPKPFPTAAYDALENGTPSRKQKCKQERSLAVTVFADDNPLDSMNETHAELRDESLESGNPLPGFQQRLAVGRNLTTLGAVRTTNAELHMGHNEPIHRPTNAINTSSLYGDFIRPNGHCSARPISLQPLAMRSIAAAELPRIYRTARPATGAMLTRQKGLSWVVFALCLTIMPPLLLAYGYGYMDGVMRYFSHGDCEEFRRQEKIAALWVGYGLFASVVVGIPIAMIVISV